MIKVFTSFSGYDSQCLALERTGIEYDLVGWSEIDSYVIRAHNALFPQWNDRKYGDIRNIDWNNVPDFDLFTYTSPCQDFSKIGKQEGGDKKSGTRSSLLWECEKAISIKRPKVLVMENVRSLASPRFIDLFNNWLSVLETYGYKNYWQIMNAKDYGVPQNRPRVIAVSIRNDLVECYGDYLFPNPIGLKHPLSHYIQTGVDKKYYLYEDNAEFIISKCKKIEEYPSVLGWTRDREGKIVNYHPVESANCLTATKRDNTQNYILELVDGVQRVRKLTEWECFALMGLTDTEIKTILESGVPKTFLHKMAGNSIVVDVLSEVFQNINYLYFNGN